MYHTTRGLILREAKYKESDKILTILTETEGKLTAKARGVARTRSKLSAATQLLCFSELTLFGNKGYWTINEATTVEQFRGLRGKLELLALGSYIAELLEAVSDEDCHTFDENRNVIPGLYVAGNVQGSRFAADYPITLKGVSHSMAMYYGYVAAKNAVNGI